jgi:hypothetical protein
MALEDMLNLINEVIVNRETITSDGTGGSTTTSVLTTLPKAALWSPSQVARYISDKVARTSSHILVTIPSDYTFTTNDDSILYNGDEYEINGPSDDVMNMGQMLITPLNRIQ